MWISSWHFDLHPVGSSSTTPPTAKWWGGRGGGMRRFGAWWWPKKQVDGMARKKKGHFIGGKYGGMNEHEVFNLKPEDFHIFGCHSMALCQKPWITWFLPELMCIIPSLFGAPGRSISAGARHMCLAASMEGGRVGWRRFGAVLWLKVLSRFSQRGDCHPPSRGYIHIHIHIYIYI